MTQDVQALAATLAATDPAGLDRPSADDEELSLTGAKLDHFEIEERLGRGGMGEVYSARDLSLERPVAIKVLRGAVTAQAGMTERFLREARAQARFNHPNIVHIYYIGRRPTPSGEDSLFFAMERLNGGDLDDVLKRGETLDPEDARQAMLQVAHGLRAAHRAGVIHRDIKPSNIMVTDDGVIKIADFGLAKPLDGDSAITQEGSLVGSPYYIAPEQAIGEAIDHRCDMYALGAAFYHLLVGRPPFEGPRAMAVVAKHLSEDLVPLSKVAPHVPAHIAKIVERLLEKKPSKRYADYDVLIDELESAAPRARPYAAITSRAVAVLIDFVVAGLLIGFLDWIGLALYLAIVTIGHGWRGQTPAKFLLGIQVVRDDGGRLGWLRALARTPLSLWMPILAGFTIALTDGIPELLAKISSLEAKSIDEFKHLLIAAAMSQGFLSLLYVGGLGLSLFQPKSKAIHDLAVGSIVVVRIKDRGPPPSGAKPVHSPSRSLGELKKKLSTPPPNDAA